jgi:response regulator RpfG family c-di-GMP phosphodiesterase
LTGYADKENAIKAINEVGLYQYIEKPWNNEDLRIILRNGVEKKQLLQKLREKMGEVTKAYDELLGIQKEVLKAFV